MANEQQKELDDILKKIEQRMRRLDNIDQERYRKQVEFLRSIKDTDKALDQAQKTLKGMVIELDEIANNFDFAKSIAVDLLNTLSKQKFALNQVKAIQRDIVRQSQQSLAVRLGEMDINEKSIRRFQQEFKTRERTLLTQQKQFEKAKDDLGLSEAQRRSAERRYNDVTDTLTILRITAKTNEEILKVDKKIEQSIGATATLLKSAEKSLQKFGLPALGIQDAFKETKRLAQEAQVTGEKFSAMGTFTKLLGNNLLDSLSYLKLIEVIIIRTIAAIGFIDKSSGELAKNLGISNVQARELISSFNEISISSDNIFVNTKNLNQAFSDLSKNLGLVKFASDAILTNQVELTKQAGYSTEAAIELTKLGAIQDKDSKEVLSNFLGQTEALNIQNGLQVSGKMLAESALKTSKATLLSLQGQGKSLGEAAFEAKRLGLELQQIEGIADSLLSIESSIAAEFEAEVITGKQLNLERARFYALTNDIAGLSREINTQVGSAAEFAAMTRIEQEAIAKSVGMSRDGLGDMLFEQEALSKLSGKANEDAQTRFNNLVREVGLEKAKAQLGNDQLANQMASANVQERFTTAIEKLQTLFLNLAEPLMPVLDAFASIAGYVGGLVSKFTPFLGVLIKAYAVIKGIGLAFTGISKASALIKSLNEKDLVIQKTKGSLSKVQNFYLKVREALLSKGFLKAKAAILLEKVGLLNAKQRNFWESRLTYFTNRRLGLNKINKGWEAASLKNSIARNFQEKLANAEAKKKLALEEGTLVAKIKQNIQAGFLNIKDRISVGLASARAAAEGMTLSAIIAQGAALVKNIVKNAADLAITVAKAAANFAAVTAATLGIGTGPLIALAAAAAAAVGGIIYAMAKGDDVLSGPSAGSGYGDRMLLGPEGAIALNNKDTVVAGTNLFKGDDVVSAGEGQIQMSDAIDYGKLASAIGGAVNDKQVTLSYTDFAQKTRPVFG